jgi:hypothetical protein
VDRPAEPQPRPTPAQAPAPARAADDAEPPRAQRKLDVFATAERQRRLGSNDAKSPSASPAASPATDAADGAAAASGEVRRLLKSGDRTEPLPALPADELKGLLGTIANTGKLPADPGRRSSAENGDVWAAPGADPAAKRSEGGDAGTRTSAPGRR